MALRVQLPEEPTPVGEFDLERRRAARTGEPERFLVRDLEPQLFAERDIDRGTAVPTDVQVRGPSRSIGHREDRFGSEDTEAQEGDRKADRESDPDLRRRICSGQNRADRKDRAQCHPDLESPSTGLPSGDESVHKTHDGYGEGGSRVGRMLRDARLGDARGREPSDAHRHKHHRSHEDSKVPPALA
jgi:hypothetical protein